MRSTTCRGFSCSRFSSKSWHLPRTPSSLRSGLDRLVSLVGLHPALPTCRVRNCLTAVSAQTASVMFTPLGRQSSHGSAKMAAATVGAALTEESVSSGSCRSCQSSPFKVLGSGRGAGRWGEFDLRLSGICTGWRLYGGFPSRRSDQPMFGQSQFRTWLSNSLAPCWTGGGRDYPGPSSRGSSCSAGRPQLGLRATFCFSGSHYCRSANQDFVIQPRSHRGKTGQSHQCTS